MFAYIKGTLEIKQNDYIVVEANGVGYKINTSMSTIGALGAIGDSVKIFTHLYVREDMMSLYGFLTNEEMSMFELLLGVSGVGPKASLSLLSSVSPSKFGLAVITDDVKSLVKAQGIGTKMAQRIILELKDKIKKEQISQQNQVETDTITLEGKEITEAVSALMVLGYTSQEAYKAVHSIFKEGTDVETIIKNSLKVLAK